MRVTHWINLVSFVALVVSGVAILLAHPRFYWGETGSVGTPSLLDLPLPFVLTGQTGWGRSLHFLSAWVCVLNGLVYLIAKPHYAIYDRLQRSAYTIVVFVLFPLTIWTGLAMSPAVTSVFPALATLLGGRQSARTIHFFVADALLLFLLVHIVMVIRTRHLRAMIVGTNG